MKYPRLCLFSLLTSALLLTACSTTTPSNQPPTQEDLRAEARRLAAQTDRIQIVPDDPNCVDSELGNSRVRTCLVHTVQPSGFHNEEFGPRVATVFQTPYGTIGNPMAWTVEIRKNGELIVRQALTDAENQTIERDGFIEVESTIPLGELQEIESGEYEVIYTPDDEDAEPIRSVIQIDEDQIDTDPNTLENQSEPEKTD